ncbi:MAG: F0F1 ATP synthase subunit B [Candidatus Margulisiibacteriota bacterium]
MLEFEPGLMIWTTLAFGLLVVLLYKVALPPILIFLAEREKLIASSLAEAERGRVERASLLEKQKAELREVRGQANQILAQARDAGDRLKKELVERVGEQSALLAKEAKLEIAREKDKALDAVRSEAASLVALAASKVLGRTVDLNDHKQLIEESLRR